MFVHLVEDQVLESEPLAKAMEQMDSTVKQANASVINLLKLDILISFLLSWHLRGISVIL